MLGGLVGDVEHRRLEPEEHQRGAREESAVGAGDEEEVGSARGRLLSLLSGSRRLRSDEAATAVALALFLRRRGGGRDDFRQGGSR